MREKDSALGISAVVKNRVDEKPELYAGKNILLNLLLFLQKCSHSNANHIQEIKKWFKD